MSDPCIICGDLVASTVDCDECQDAHYCSQECYDTDELHELLCVGLHPFENRPCSKTVRGIFFGSDDDIPVFIWILSSNNGATISHVEQIIGTASRSFPIEANPVRNRIIEQPIRCFQSVPGGSLPRTKAINSVISKCKRWNGNISRNKRYNWTGNVVFMGDNRDLSYQDFRHIIDDISVYRSGNNMDQSLWGERAKKILGLKVEHSGSEENCQSRISTILYYPQDHPFFLDPDSRPKPPTISIIKSLELPIIVEEIDQISDPTVDMFFDGGAMRSLLTDNPSSGYSFSAKFVRSDGKDLLEDHVYELFRFIGEKIIPITAQRYRFPLDVAGDVLRMATRANFEAHWDAVKPGVFYNTTLSPYHDVEKEEIGSSALVLARR